VLTLALNPYQAETVPLVRTRELRTGQSAQPAVLPQLVESTQRRTWTIGGQVRTDQPLENLRLTLIERGLEVALQSEGRFAIGNLQPGDYTLEVVAAGRQPRRYQITVPAADYELEI
jgi:hypothetical protein